MAFDRYIRTCPATLFELGVFDVMFDKWAKSDILQAVAAKIVVSRARDTLHAHPTLSSAVRSLCAARHLATARSLSRPRQRTLPHDEPTEDARAKEVVRDGSTLPNANRLPQPTAAPSAAPASAPASEREGSTRDRLPSRRRSAERRGSASDKKRAGKSFILPALVPSLPSVCGEKPLARGDKPTSARGGKPSARGDKPSARVANYPKPIITPRARTPDPTTARSSLWCKHLREMSTARSSAATTRRSKGAKPSTAHAQADSGSAPHHSPQGSSPVAPQRPGCRSSLHRCSSFLQELVQDVERERSSSRRERAPSTRRGSSLMVDQRAAAKARRLRSELSGQLVTI